MPATPTYNNQQYLTFVYLREIPGYDPVVVGAAPIKLYNNTFRFDRTYAENNNNNIGFLDDDSEGRFTGYNEINNVVHIPNLTPPNDDVTFAPLTEAALWLPRTTGRRDEFTLIWDTTYATPTDAVKDSKPDAGSAALDAATTGDIGYHDVVGKDPRPIPANMGASE